MIIVVDRALVGVLGLRLFALGAVAVLPIVGVVIGVLLWPFAGVLGLWELVAVVALRGVLGLREVVVVVALVIVLGLWEVIARLGSTRFGHCGGLMPVAGMLDVML